MSRDAAKLRIVHALAPGSIGGIESVVRLLAAGQQAAGHRVDLITVVDGPDHPFVEQLREQNLPVHPIVAPDRAYREEISQFRGLLGELAPQIVHTHGTRPDVLLAGPARKSGCATVTTVHGFSGGGWKNRLYEHLQRRAMRKIGAVAAVSEAQVEVLTRAGVPRASITVVPNAWQPLGEPLDRGDARKALGLADEARVIGYVGRLSFEKGPDLLLEALSQLKDLPWQASILGSGAEEDVLAKQCESAGLGERVRWHGAVHDAWKYFRAFDLLAMPSRTEGTPISLFEAMSARVPLVVTRVGGVPAVLDPAPPKPPLATLVPALDPAALAAGIRDILVGETETGPQTTAAAARLESEYATAPWLGRYDDLYRGLL